MKRANPSAFDFDFDTKKSIAIKKQKASEVGPSTPIPPKTGTAFFNGIRDLARHSNESVRADLKVSYMLEGMAKYHEHQITGTFSVLTDGSRTQGLLMPMGNTSYFNKKGEPKVLPKDLSLSRATLESRVIKHLSPGGETYDPNEFYVDVRGENGKLTKKGGKEYAAKSPVGGIALASFLEDVTAQRAVGLKGVGSAMRAEVMTAKWNMRTKGTMESPNFAANMLKQFPQLGKKSGEGVEGGIVRIKEDWDQKKTNPIITKEQQVQNIFDAHVRAKDAAVGRLTAKFTRIAMAHPDDREGTIKKQGKWWANNAEKIKGKLDKWEKLKKSDPDKRAASQQKFAAKYVDYKFKRHGIKTD